jgi:hypothetical protein
MLGGQCGLDLVEQIERHGLAKKSEEERSP